MALCPSHNDHTASLSIKSVNSKILLHCHAGCAAIDIASDLRLTMADLNLNGSNTTPGFRQIEAVYRYTDANGKPFEVVRTNPKGFYQRQPDGNGGYIINLKGIVLTLYHQDKVKLAIGNATPVIFVEGEKDADRLWSLEMVATTNPMGAGKWRNSYTEVLQGADLIVIADKDSPGRDHANRVANSCYSRAARIRILELPGGGKDVSDWLNNGRNRESLKRLITEAPEWKPSRDNKAVGLVCMADVEAEEVDWLWFPYIPKGKLTLLEGDPGVGKSWVSLAIATAVSLGKGLYGMVADEPAKVVIASTEDGHGDTIRPRLDSMAANVKQIYAI
ncbi:MAG: AAA family ATPase [candidate division Zixibacteria bacterium]|nr:AAA family ATPase [candidate division Zixibacteria bacterium]